MSLSAFPLTLTNDVAMNENRGASKIADFWKNPEADAGALAKWWMAVTGFFIGLCAGAVISVFRIGTSSVYAWVVNWCKGGHNGFLGAFCLFAGVVVAALITGRLIRNPAIRSGGGPWVKKALADGQPRVWRIILIPKFIGSFLVMACGVSVGREGPCIQMGAATALGLKRFDQKERAERKYYILGGGAAGLAAAFSAPLAGICYAYEVMGAVFTAPLFYFMLSGAVGVYVACDLIFGLGVMLPMSANAPGLVDLAVLAPVGLFAGLTGIAYNYLLRFSLHIFERQKFIRQEYRPLCAFLGAGLALLAWPAITGEGLSIFSSITGGEALLGYLCLFLAAKLLFTAFCYGTGIPAGVMVPVLCVGGVTGGIYAQCLAAFGVLPPGLEHSCLVLGMAAAFSAAERAPVTGVVLVAQMTGAYAALPGLVLTSGIAALLAKSAKTRRYLSRDEKSR